MSIHEVERLIHQLDNPIRKAKVKAAEQLKSLTIFPDIISDSTLFINKCFVPIIKHLENTTESIREDCLSIIDKSIKNLGRENLQNILVYLIPALFSRLKNQNIEPAEQIRHLLMIQLLSIIQMITPETTPNTFDSYISDLFDPLDSSFRSDDSEMKKLAFQVLDEAMLRSSLNSLSEFAIKLTPSLIINCRHRNSDIRKSSLHSLALLFIHSGAYGNNYEMNSILTTLSTDKNSNVRKEVILFCTRVFSWHIKKDELYPSLLIPLFYFSSSIVKRRPIRAQSTIEQVDDYSEEAIFSFYSINEIGLIEMGKNQNLNESISIFDFDQEYVANEGIVHIVRTSAQKILDILLPWICHWPDELHQYSLLALNTFLQLSGEYTQRYVPHIVQQLLQSVARYENDRSYALQSHAILSSFVSSKDIWAILCHRFVQIESILLTTVTVINGDADTSTLQEIIDCCNNSKLFVLAEMVEPLIDLAIALIKSGKIMNERLLYFLLQLGEYSNAMDRFKETFDISSAFNKYFTELLSELSKSSEYLSNLLQNSSSEVILANEQLVHQSIYFNSMTSEANTLVLIRLLHNLAIKHSLSAIDLHMLKIILVNFYSEDFRSEATYALDAILANNVIDQTTLVSQCDSILRAIFLSLKDNSDDIRIVAARSLLSLVRLLPDWSKFYTSISSELISRLSDRVNEIRLMAIETYCIVLPKSLACPSINTQWKELLVHIDDEDEEIRSAFAELIKIVVAIPIFKDEVIKTLKEIPKHHTASAHLCSRLISEFE